MNSLFKGFNPHSDGAVLRHVSVLSPQAQFILVHMPTFTPRAARTLFRPAQNWMFHHDDATLAESKGY